MLKNEKPALADVKVHVRFKLSAIWTGLMFLYIYNDYFNLYEPGSLSAMMQGKMAFFHVTQGVMLGTSMVVVIPALMIVLSVVLKPDILRLLSIVFGALYTVIDILTMIGSWWYFIAFNAIETVLTLSIIWLAWRWPTDVRP